MASYSQQAEVARSEMEHAIAAKPETGEQWAEICRLECVAMALERQAELDRSMDCFTARQMARPFDDRNFE